MNNTTPIDPTERKLARLALAAKATGAPGACPSDNEFAVFIEGKLQGAGREEMLAHLNHCPTCYHHWLEVSSYLANATLPAPETSSSSNEAPEVIVQPLTEPRRRGRWSGFLGQIQAFFTPGKVWLPAAAVAAVFVYVILSWPALFMGSSAPDLNQAIDDGYAALLVNDTDDIGRIGSKLTLPGEEAALGFSASRITPPAQAFAAGLWTGKAALSGHAKITLPERYSSGAAQAWPDTEWADYYAFGRWTVLLWSLTQLDPAPLLPAQHQEIREALLAGLTARAGLEEEAERALAALKRLDLLWRAIEGNADESARAELRRLLELTMQQLAAR